MSSYTEIVQESLSQLENEDIFEKIRSGSLTDEAQQIATRILGERGIAAPATEDFVAEVVAPSKKSHAKESSGEFLSRCFRGKASLNDAVWTLGVGLWIAVGIPAALLKATPVPWLGGIVLLISLLFRDIAIWRCAPNAKRVFWGIAARAWIFLSNGFIVVTLLSR